MIPVYQTIMDNKRGNCQAAVWASLLHLSIEEVPNFVEFENDHDEVCKFIEPFGYSYAGYIVNGNRPDLTEEQKASYEFLNNPLPDFGHIDGYYDAVVFSPGYWDAERFKNDPSYMPVCHAVIVDKQLNIVHDPNPKYKGLKQYPLADQIGHNGVIGVCLYTKNQHSYVTN